jgi:hypothetical protein
MPSPARASGRKHVGSKHRSVKTTILQLIGLVLCVLAAQADPPRPSRPQENKTHWSFVPPRHATPPAVKNRRWLRNPIDAFILARLERERVSPSPEADRATLIRRLSLDLLGLPPGPGEVRAFETDPRPEAWERLVDSLLASPHFGERWGRHWLDLARYADSEGYQIDRPRPGAYVYRDWVIDSFNRDQPFDQFTIEQLAGDLLPNATTDQRIATGFHRNTMMNYEEGVDSEEFRCKAKVDRVSTTGAVWLGLTVGCAQCHSHKYDPIGQREFYQCYAFFNDAEEVELSSSKPADAAVKALGLAPIAQPPKTFLHVRGDYLRPGEEVQPGVLHALHPFQARGVRADRLDLARWLVDPANPLTARVAVNQLWQHLFGRGLVSTPEDFGVRGERPSHPELLDWLATEFQQRGWSRKQMLKLMVTSATYRQASHAREDLVERDPLNTWLARQNRFRLESEIIRDNSLSVGGLLNTQIGGPSFRPQTPPDFKLLGGAGAFQWEDSVGPEKYRRGLYIFAQRTVPYPTAMTFDQANPCETCPRRDRSNTPLQALTLQNHALFVECSQGLARRLSAGNASAPRAAIERGFEVCLARRPVKEELDCLEKLYGEELQCVHHSPAAAATHPERPEDAAWTAVAQVLLNLDEFTTRE